MGAMLAPRIDAEGGNYRGLILLAGSPRKLEEILIDQNYDVLSQVNKMLQWILKKQIKKLENTFQSLYMLSDEEAKHKSFTGGTTLYYFKEMGEHPAPSYLANLTKPILILQGEKDFQATVARDFRAYQNLLQGQENVSFQLYPNLNHAFVPSIHGNIMKAKQEYGVEQHIGADVISDIAHWINEN